MWCLLQDLAAAGALKKREFEKVSNDFDSLGSAIGAPGPDGGPDPLSGAVERGELALHFDPIASVATRSLDAVQTRLLWAPPGHAAMGIEAFLPLSRDLAHLLNVLSWEFEQACLQARFWQTSGVRVQRVYVKLYSPLFQQVDVVRRLERVLAETGTDPHLMGVIISDALLLNDSKHVHNTLKQLRGMGLSIVVDDFGSGYWNPTYLQNLPIDTVCVDAALLGDIGSDLAHPSVARALIDLAHDLCLRVLIKNVSSHDLMPYFKRHQCKLMQGPLVAPSVDVQGLAEYIQAHGTAPDGAAGPKRTLLLVDDEANILSALRRLFRPCGYNIILANSGAEGLERIKETSVDVIISDQRMPGMTGVEFLREAKVLCPDTMRIVLSGYTELQSITDAINEGAIYKFLTKPWDDELLKAQIEGAFRHKEMLDENLQLTRAIKDMNVQLAQANAKLEKQISVNEARIEKRETLMGATTELLQNIPCPMIGLDSDGVLTFLNDEGQTCLGLDAGAVLGEQADAVLPPALMAAAQQVLGSRQNVVHLQGHPYWVMSRSLGPEQRGSGQLLMLLPYLPQAADEGEVQRE